MYFSLCGGVRSAAALTLKRSGSGSGFGGRLAALISSHDFSFRVRVRIWAASRMDPKVMVWKNEIVFVCIYGPGHWAMGALVPWVPAVVTYAAALV